MKDLEELLNAIYLDIQKRNASRGLQAIPQSEEFFSQITRDYSVMPFAVPALIKILADSHKIFTFKLVEADHAKRARRIEGFVVTEGNIIKTLLDHYSDELVRVYSHEFSLKYSVERIIKEFLPKLPDYNNTELGKIMNIVLNLMTFQSLLERNIMQYGQKWQEKQLRAEIEKSDPLSFFIDKDFGTSENDESKSPQADDKNTRAIEASRYEDFKKYQSKNSIDKTIAVYGMEFYSRVCFRDYQFSLMFKLVEEGIINEKEDLLVVKKMLQKTRANSDKDLNLQKYALEINNLEKLINNKIKEGGS